jgi:excisionase family DNA binding protein
VTDQDGVPVRRLSPAELPDVITPAETGQLLGKSTETILRWCRDGVIPARHVGGSLLISKPAVMR